METIASSQVDQRENFQNLSPFFKVFLLATQIVLINLNVSFYAAIEPCFFFLNKQPTQGVGDCAILSYLLSFVTFFYH